MPNQSRNAFLFPALGLLVVLTAVHCVLSWSNYSSLDGASGVWVALADDFSKGIFYRPIIGEHGYGGTRYFPLYFVIHGFLARWGVDLIVGGFALSAASVLLLMAGLHRLLRNNGIDRLRSITGSLLLLTSTSVLLSLTTIRGDALPLAFNVFGLAILDERKGGTANLLQASLLFTLAFACKVTAVSAMVACLAALAMNRRFKQVFLLSLFCAAGYLFVLGVMVLGSEGRAIEVFRTCSSGGASWVDLLKSPTRFMTVLSYMDSGSLLSLFLGLFSFFAVTGREAYRKLSSFFLLSTAVTVVVFGSPGTNYNQFIDMHAAAIALFVVFLTTLEGRGLRTYDHIAVSLILLASVGIVSYIRHVDTNRYRQEYAEIRGLLGKEGAKPRVLAENPIIPVLLRQRPYILDPFMLRIIRNNHPELRTDLPDRLRKGEFDHVLLFSADPRTPRGRSRLSTDVFGDGFLDALEEKYRLERELGNQMIYVPIGSS
jgi:hypothetical protein